MLTILGAAIAGSALPQSRPAFEVATLKAAAPSSARGSISGGVGTSDPGLFVCTNMPLRALILRAWDIPAFRLSGPGSIETARYDISARVPLHASREEFNLMIQNLLTERLHLVVHEEGAERDVYQMAIADGGLKMKETDPAAGVQTRRDEAVGAGVTRIVAHAQSLTDVLNMMGNYSGRAVIDKTGLTGQYDYNLVFANDAVGAPEADLARPFPVAVVQQLGLRLVPARATIRILHVDRFNKVPDTN